MSICKFCGAQIDFIQMKSGAFMPVDPEPVFIIEGNMRDTFITDEGETIKGQMISNSEIPFCDVAFVPHWKMCLAAGRFRRK